MMKKAQTTKPNTTVKAVAEPQKPAAKAAKRAVVFSFPGNEGHQVFLAGSFTDWQERPLAYKAGAYILKLMLAPGEYQYKFVVDGEWHLDDANPNFTPNGFGTLNSVIVVKEK